MKKGKAKAEPQGKAKAKPKSVEKKQTIKKDKNNADDEKDEDEEIDEIVDLFSPSWEETYVENPPIVGAKKGQLLKFKVYV